MNIINLKISFAPLMVLAGTFSTRGRQCKAYPAVETIILFTGTENPYTVSYNTESGNFRSYQYTVIDIPIFTATRIFKPGNHATD